jgi:hypothetical protein
MSPGEVANQPYFVKEVALAPAELAEEVLPDVYYCLLLGSCQGGNHVSWWDNQAPSFIEKTFDFWLTSFNNFNFSPSPLLNHITLFVHEEGAATTFSNVLGGAENRPPKLAGTFGV